MNIPSNYRQIYSRSDVAASVKKVAGEINEWNKLVLDSDDDPLLAICVLRGAIFFFADLLRELDCPIDPTFCQAESYSMDNEKIAKGVRVSVEGIIAQGRHVLLIDDICDTGLTLLKLHNVFLELGAKSVRSAVLIHREVEQSKFEPTWSAFDYSGDEWFVGYGLDDGGLHRNLPDVYVIEPKS